MAHILRKLTKLSRLLSQRTYRLGLRHGVGAAIEHEAALRSINMNTLIDIGANTGQFALTVRVTHPSTTIIALEPLAGPASRFRAIFKDDPNTLLHQLAAGDVEQDRAINVSARPDSSSLLPISKRQSEIFPGTEEVTKSIIKVARVDDIIDGATLSAPIVIKLDVQGFELAALRGMPHLLELANHVYVEVSFIELYTGQPLASDVLAFLSTKGFRLSAVHNLVQTKGGAPVQADFLFANERSDASSYESSAPHP